MTSRQQRVLTLGVVIASIFALFGSQTVRTSLSPSAGTATQSEEQRLHDLALRDLKETQDEVAKMKAHGIGMHPQAEH